jgi:GT2 family glycosyltransferase/glycosyltransferase involved in cell wall biosynthesis
MPIVDIVVPVYRGAEATRRCLESVLAAQVRTAYEVIVVNDASAEPEVERYVRELAQRRRVTLIEQATHQGFAAALNRAVALHRDRDVVVLHADAEVANDWLDRLSTHALERDVGAIAPMTNAYGTATYPLPDAANPIPPDQTVASLDALFARANDGESAGLPALEGPCLYVRRECLATVGAFDGGPLGSDYAVLTDFCLRAASAGFRLHLAGDVFVAHVGHVSFGAEAEALRERSLHALDRLYPGYATRRAEILEHEPGRPYARRVDLLRLAQGTRPVLLFVSHPWGGGIRRHMDDLAALIGERGTVLYLEPAADDTVKLYCPRAGESFAAYFRLPHDLPRLAATVRTIRVARIHFHHVHRLPRAILDLPSAAGVPYDCTLHDYYAICPQYHLVTEEGRYCGEPDAAGCTACLARRPAQWGLDIGAWRSVFARLLRGADRLIAPSNDVAQRITRYVPDASITVWPHPESTPPPPPRVVRVVLLGNLTPEKGLHVAAACAEDARDRRLPMTFRVLGSTTEPVPQWPDVPLTIHGQYQDSELAHLLAAEKADVLWFPAQVPETYSYTLSVALASGLPIVASALGALPERLAQHPRCATVPWNAPAAEWNAALLSVAGLAERAPPAEARVLVAQRVLAS